MDLAPVLSYIAEYWPHIIRGNPREQQSLIGLPRPYVVPSAGDMFSEMYYWDSYFMSLGLVGTPHQGLIRDMTENMAALFRRFGLIPNASRYYFLSRSQPPFFSRMIWLTYDCFNDPTTVEARRWLGRMMRLAEREHESVWLGTTQPHFRQVYRGLSRYFDVNFLDFLASCESGWDHSTRCGDRWLDHLPVDLNSILYMREMDFARAAEILGAPRRAAEWHRRAEVRAATLRELMWDEQVGIFLDYDWVRQERDPDPSLAGFYPLWAGWATPVQAERIVRDWLPRFQQPGGLVTTLKERAGRQWAWPNGWAPLQWIVADGLERYGFGVEAQAIRESWCANCVAVFAATGILWEKYNVVQVGADPEGGLYGSVPGFGWTNGVVADFARRLL
ncbi:MAG: trehalase family glycosidase [Chloroflexota bacterium]